MRSGQGILAAILALSIGLPGTARSEDPNREPDKAAVQELWDAWKKDRVRRDIEITYPLDGTLFPPELPPPAFLWNDASKSADSWLVAVELEGQAEPVIAMTQKREWRPGTAAWETIKRLSQEEDARFHVVGFQRNAPSKAVSAASVAFQTSRDEVGAPIFYRDVPLPFIYAVKNPETIRWRLGEVGSDKPPPIVLQGLPVCGNCHSFSRDGKTMGMDVDYANDKASYAITAVEKKTVLSADRVITWADYRREDGKPTFGLLSQVSPDGRYVMSTVKDCSVFVPKDDLKYSQLFFPIKGILVFYDRQTRAFSALPGADEPRYVQSNPSWTPDGKTVIFARTEATEVRGAEKLNTVLVPPHLVKDFLDGSRGFQYSLYRIPFNGGQGGTAEPVPGASHNGLSNYFPRLSPDRKWLVSTRAKNFMLLQPDSKLYIMPAEGGGPRAMRCNTPAMNSWHSWSPNSRWLVFASKARGPYTQLYLTHIDESGQDTPAVFLEYLSLEGRAANIPEFANVRGAMDGIVEQFLADHHFARQADILAVEHGEYAKSVKYFRRALNLNPDNVDVRISLGAVLMAINDFRSAEEELKKALRIQPANALALSNLGSVYGRTGRFREAQETYEKVLAVDPQYRDAYVRLGFTCLHLENDEEAEKMFREALRLDRHCVRALYYLGSLADKRSQPGEALKYYHAALQHVPDRQEPSLGVAQDLMHRKHLHDSIGRLLESIIEEDPRSVRAYLLLGQLRLQQADPEGAIKAFESAKKSGPVPPWVGPKIEELKFQRSRNGGTQGNPAPR